jgi:hypothetical protein
MGGKPMGIVGCMHMDNLRRIFALIGVSHPNREKLNFKSSFREESKNTAHTAGRTWSALSMICLKSAITARARNYLMQSKGNAYRHHVSNFSQQFSLARHSFLAGPECAIYVSVDSTFDGLM